MLVVFFFFGSLLGLEVLVLFGVSIVLVLFWNENYVKLIILVVKEES